jgi:tetratricopeptide (TPR) repeat protein
MKLRFAICTFLMVVIAIEGVASSLPKPGEQWIEIKTANFRFFSNAGARATKRVAVDLEELRAVLAKLTNYDLQSPVPTHIYVFKHDRSFTPYKVLYQGKPGAVTGYFAQRELANFIAIDASAEDASGIVYHEYVHNVAANNFWYLPVWFEEGLAELYQTFEVVGNTVYIGLANQHNLRLLRGSTSIPLAELLTVDHQSPLYNEEDRKTLFYSQSWALVHYLLLGNDDRRRQLENYFVLIRKGTRDPEAFRTAFETDLKAFEKELRGYLNLGRFPALKATTEINLEAAMTVHQMPYSEVLFRLGDLLANHDPPRPERIEYFEAALLADPEHGPSLAALALEAEMAADWGRALVAYERAAAASPDDALIHYRWGELLYRRGKDREKALSTLRRSAELDPALAPTWAALSAIYAEMGETSADAVEAAETAHTLLPSNTEVSGDLLRIYVALDQREKAVALVGDAFTENTRVRAQAWMVVLQNDFRRAREFLYADQSAAALHRLDLAEEDVDRTARPEFMRRAIADIRLSAAEHEGAKKYRRALDLYEEGETDAARGLLEEALSELDSGPVALSCRRLLEIIEHPELANPQPEITILTDPTDEEIDRLNVFLGNGDFDGALHLLEDMRDGSSGVRQGWIDRKIAEIQRAIDYNHFVDSYNRAVELYNRREFAEAIRVLEELLAELPEGPDAVAVRSLLEEARTGLSSR